MVSFKPWYFAAIRQHHIAPAVFDNIQIAKFQNTIFLSPGFIWSEIKQLWDVGLREYIRDVWNVVDFITNALYVATIALRLVAYCDVSILVILLVIVASGKIRLYHEIEIGILEEIQIETGGVRTFNIKY